MVILNSMDKFHRILLEVLHIRETKSLCTMCSLLLHFYVADVWILISNSEMPQKSKSSNGFQEN